MRRADPTVTDLQRQIDEAIAERERVERLYMEIEGRIHGLAQQRSRRIKSATATQHGHRVDAGTISVRRHHDDRSSATSWFAQAVADGVYAKLASIDAHAPDRLQKFAEATGHCPDCFVRVDNENAGVPDEPGKIHVWCNWCREHRGKTHCDNCGKPLSADEQDAGTCGDCEERDGSAIALFASGTVARCAGRPHGSAV